MDKVVLRSWRMPVRAAALCVSVWPLIGAVLVVAIFGVFGWDSPQTWSWLSHFAAPPNEGMCTR